MSKQSRSNPEGKPLTEVIVVMYNIWSFLFAHFRKTDTIGPFKSASGKPVTFLFTLGSCSSWLPLL